MPAEAAVHSSDEPGSLRHVYFHGVSVEDRERLTDDKMRDQDFECA
jgi:hypothetical protein